MGSYALVVTLADASSKNTSTVALLLPAARASVVAERAIVVIDLRFLDWGAEGGFGRCFLSANHSARSVTRRSGVCVCCTWCHMLLHMQQNSTQMQR